MNTQKAVFTACVLVGGIAVGAWWLTVRVGGPTPPDKSPAVAEVLYWYDPMVADKKFDRPSKSPFMDMQLVPKYAKGTNERGQP